VCASARIPLGRDIVGDERRSASESGVPCLRNPVCNRRRRILLAPTRGRSDFSCRFLRSEEFLLATSPLFSIENCCFLAALTRYSENLGNCASLVI